MYTKCFTPKKIQSIEALFNSIFPLFFHPFTKIDNVFITITCNGTFAYIYAALWNGTEGANGEGVAIVSSLSSFDREQQKEYLLPIVIKDSGK